MSRAGMVRLLVCILLFAAGCDNLRTPPQTLQGRLIIFDSKQQKVSWLNAAATIPIVEGVSSATLCVVNSAETVAVIATQADKTGGYTLFAVNFRQPGPPILIGQVASLLSCQVGGHIQFTSDNAVVAYLDYAADATVGTDYAAGTLRLVRLINGSVIMSIPDVAGFQIDRETILAMVPVADRTTPGALPKNVTLMQWSAKGGTSAATVPGILMAATGCGVVSARVAVQSGTIYTALGERCPAPTRYYSTVYRYDRTTAQFTPLTEHKLTGGKFYPGANTHVLVALPDGKTLLWGFPDGVRVETATLRKVENDTGKYENMALQLRTDSFPALQAGRLGAVSPDGTQMAYVTVNEAGGDTLWLWQIDKPETEPAELTGQIRSNRIGQVVWANGGQRLFYLIESGQPLGINYIDLGGKRGATANSEGASAIVPGYNGEYLYRNGPKTKSPGVLYQVPVADYNAMLPVYPNEGDTNAAVLYSAPPLAP